METANALSKPSWRPHVVSLFDQTRDRQDIEVIAFSPDLWDRGWTLYRNRLDKAWSLTDCISFEVMREQGIIDALTSDSDFQQAGFRALLLT